MGINWREHDAECDCIRLLCGAVSRHYGRDRSRSSRENAGCLGLELFSWTFKLTNLSSFLLVLDFLLSMYLSDWPEVNVLGILGFIKPIANKCFCEFLLLLTKTGLFPVKSISPRRLHSHYGG